MAEPLRDLVVSLSLNTENFTRNIRSVNKQIQEAESYFKLASAGLDFLGTLSRMLPGNTFLGAVTAFAGSDIPLFRLGLGWVVPACVGFALGLCIKASKKA